MRRMRIHASVCCTVRRNAYEIETRDEREQVSDRQRGLDQQAHAIGGQGSEQPDAMI